MKNPSQLNIRTVNVAIGEEFTQVDVVFDGTKKAKVIIPTDTAADARTYLVNSQDVMANIALSLIARNLLKEIVADKGEEKT